METSLEELFLTPEWIQPRMVQNVAQGCQLLPYCNREKLAGDEEVYVHFKEEMTAKEAVEKGYQNKPRRIAPGAELQVVQTSEVKSETAVLYKTGHKIVIDKNKLKQRGAQILRVVERLAYTMGTQLESQISHAFMQGTAPTADIKTPWDRSDGINKDIRRRKTVFFDESLPFQLNTFLYHPNNLEQLCNYKEAINNTGTYDFPGFSEGNTQHLYGGMTTPEGVSFGLDRNAMAATVAYAFDDNGGVSNVMKGMESYAPYINVLVKDVSDERPQKLIMFMDMINEVVLEVPRAIQVQKGLSNPKTTGNKTQ